jgi:histone H2B
MAKINEKQAEDSVQEKDTTLVDSSSVIKKKKKPKRRPETFSFFIHKVQKQMHKDCSMSSKAMSIMNSFVNDMFEQIATESSRLCKITKRPTMSARDIQAAVRLIMPGDLGKFAGSEATKAVAKYVTYK